MHFSDDDDHPHVGGPHVAFEMGRVFWSLVVGELVGRLLRTSGKLPAATGEQKPIVGRHLLSATTPRHGDDNMTGFDIVGDDDDLGAIGYEDIIGEDDLDFLDTLVEGDMEDLIGEDDDDDDEDLLVGGDGSSEIIGARRRGRRRRRRSSSAARRKAAMRKLAMRNAGAVIKRGLDRRRRYPLGFVPTDIIAAATSLIPSTPQNLFRPERLVIPSDIAFDSGVTDVKVGNQSQFVETAEVPGSLFSEVAINTGVTFDTAEVGNQISVSVRNKSLADFEFTAGLVGTIAK